MWYIGQFIDVNPDGSFRVSHYAPKSALRKEWIVPALTDIHDISIEQVVPITVEGHWDFASRIVKYVVDNLDDISATFTEICG